MAKRKRDEGGDSSDDSDDKVEDGSGSDSDSSSDSGSDSDSGSSSDSDSDSDSSSDESEESETEKNFLLPLRPHTDDQVKQLREELDIEVEAPEGLCPPPVLDTSDPCLPRIFATYMQRAKWTTPTAIQKQCWPAILTGNDLVAIGATGSGKTLSYLLPAVPHILSKFQKPGPLAMILVPTRELAIQVGSVARSLQSLFNLRSFAVYGGVDKQRQQDMLASKKDSIHLLVGTPGRVLDLSSEISLRNVSYTVLDEMDKLLQPGLAEQVEELLSQTKKNGQRLLLSATLAPELTKAAAALLKSPFIKVQVGVKQTVTGSATLNKDIVQTVHVCSEHKKLKKLIRTFQLIKKEYEENNPGNRNRVQVIVFANKIKTVQMLISFLAKNQGIVGNCRSLFGNMRQQERTEIMASFRAGKYNVLVTTDLAGRGVDIRRLTYIINYDFPPTLQQYVHRVGRVGRAGQGGRAYTFFTRNREPLAPMLVELLKDTNQWLDPNLLQLCPKVLSEESDEEQERKQIQDRKKKNELDLGDGQEKKQATPVATVNYESSSDSERDPHAIPAWLRNQGVQPESSSSDEEQEASSRETKEAAAEDNNESDAAMSDEDHDSESEADPHALPSWLLNHKPVAVETSSEEEEEEEEDGDDGADDETQQGNTTIPEQKDKRSSGAKGTQQPKKPKVSSKAGLLREMLGFGGEGDMPSWMEAEKSSSDEQEQPKPVRKQPTVQHQAQPKKQTPRPPVQAGGKQGGPKGIEGGGSKDTGSKDGGMKRVRDCATDEEKKELLRKKRRLKQKNKRLQAIKQKRQKEKDDARRLKVLFARGQLKES